MRFLGILVLLAGCSAGSTCTPGASVACACGDGTQGAQICRPDGTFDSCQCTIQHGGPVVDMGGNSQNPILHDLALSPATGGKRVFVTSTAYLGSAVTSACSDAAAAANLGGTWDAWLSTQSMDAIDKVTGSGPWKRLDGQVAFNNHAGLATQPLVAIDITENGT